MSELPKLTPRDHPDNHVMSWSESEIRFIDARVEQATEELRQQLTDAQTECTALRATEQNLRQQLEEAKKGLEFFESVQAADTTLHHAISTAQSERDELRQQLAAANERVKELEAQPEQMLEDVEHYRLQMAAIDSRFPRRT